MVSNYVGSGGNCDAVGTGSDAWNCTTVDDRANDVGYDPSIAFDLSGNAWVSHTNGTTNALIVSNYVGSGGNCDAVGTGSDAWNCTTVDDRVDFVGYDTSIAFDASGNAWVSHMNSSTGALIVSNYVGSGGNCDVVGTGSDAWNCTTVDDRVDFVSYDTSIAFDASGNAWVSHKNNSTKALIVSNYVGSGGNCDAVGTGSDAWNCTTVDDRANEVGVYTSIAFDLSGNAWVSHQNSSTAALIVSNYVGSGGNCDAVGTGSDAWNCTTVDDRVDFVGYFTSIAFDLSGNPWVSYQNGTTNALIVSKLHLPSFGTNSRYLFDTKGYSDSSADDAVMDPMTALVNERPYQLFRVQNTNALDTPAATWIGQSTIAAGTQNIKLEVYRFGTTNAWETTTTNSTCSANTDCTITNGALAGPVGEYYENTGSCGTTCKVYWRGWQAESASGTTTLKVDTFNGTFGSGVLSVSGTVCTNEACSTNVGSGVTVVLKKNGTDACSGACTAVTNASGVYTITPIASMAANDIFTIYVGGTAATDDDGTYNAVTVTKISASGSLSNINLITSRIILRHEGAITSLANTDLAGWDKDNDADIKFTSNAGAFVSDNTEEVHVWTAKSWIPAGTVTTNSTATAAGAGGDLHIDASSVLNIAANALSVGGDFTNAGTFTSAGQNTTFTATGTGFAIDNGTGNLNNVTFNGASGGWSFSDASNTIDGDLTVTAGTLSGTTNLTVSGGDVTGAGDINLTGGTFTLAGTGTIGSNTAWDFNDMVFNGTTTRTAATTGSITATGSVTGSGSLDLKDTTNTFEQRVAANQNFGTSSGTNNWTFNNLTFSNSSGADRTISPPVNASAGSIIVTGTLQIGKTADSFNTIFDNDTANDRVIDVDGSVDIQSKGQLKASSTAGFTVGVNWTRTGTFTPGTGTVQFVCTNSSTCPASLISSSTTWYSLTITNAVAPTVTKLVKFGDTTIQTTSAGGILTITGASGALTTIDSEGGVTNWNITHNASATESVDYVTVNNSTCASSSAITTTNSSGVDADLACWLFGGTATLTQRAYIFEDDDGTNVNNSNSQIASNTARVGVRKGERLNIRVQIDNTGAGAAPAQTYDLQVCNFTDTACDIPAEWVTVTTGSGDIRASQGLAGGSGDDLSVSGADRAINTTASGSDCVQAGPTFDATANTSEWYENTGTSNSITITNNKCIEMSYAVHTANSTVSKEYRFRVVKTSGATVLDGYSQYPTLTIGSSEDQRYYKNTASTIANSDVQGSNTTYYFDNKGYATSLAADDSNFDPITSSANVPVFGFVKKFASVTEYPDIRAIIQLTVAASTRNILLQVYCFGGANCTDGGGVNSWETVTTNSTLAADIDGELNTSSWSPDSATKSDYYENGGSCGIACWTYFRLYQTSGAQTLKVDWVGQPLYLSSTYIISQTFDTNAVNGAGYHSIIWKGTKPAGTNVKIQLATSDCANGKTNPPACDSGGGWGSSSDYYADNGTTCAVTNYYTPAPGVSQKLNKCNTQFNNKRYFRYKVILEASPTRDAIPTVDDISVNWTP